MVKITGIVKEDSLRQSIAESVKPGFVDVNHKAMEIGFELAKNYKK
jgi:Pyruvate/2-oxoacid:ferredoxin oxidoreductase gamma subunit